MGKTIKKYRPFGVPMNTFQPVLRLRELGELEAGFVEATQQWKHPQKDQPWIQNLHPAVGSTWIHPKFTINLWVMALLASWPCLGSPLSRGASFESRCQAKSLYTRDWREAIDPIWGRRYFINRWSGRLGPQEMGPQNMALEFDPARKRGWKMSETTKNWWFSGSMLIYQRVHSKWDYHLYLTKKWDYHLNIIIIIINVTVYKWSQ